MIVPFVDEADRRPTADFWKGIGATLAQGAEAAAPPGLKVLWHNHAFEYVTLPDGTRPIDHILAAPDVWFEIDCGWVARGGAEPAAELSRYADRILVIQTKDLGPSGTTVDDGRTTTGAGVIDWARLAPLFRKTAAHHLCTEHDNPSDWKQFASHPTAFCEVLASNWTTCDGRVKRNDPLTT